jgi:hypothetical protein
MPAALQCLFQTDNAARDKFLSRLFGIFNEKIVRCWCKDGNAPYVDLGRPTFKKEQPRGRGKTLDFTFRSKADNRIYIAEMKCWLEYENYKYLTLNEPEQLRGCDNEAFRLFLKAAKEPSQATVTVNSKPQRIDGCILVWGRCSEQGRTRTIAEFGFHDVLSLEDIISSLANWNNQEFLKLLEDRRAWTEYLFSGLVGTGTACRL